MARLVYSDTDDPGISRKALKNGWAYFTPDGKRITNSEEVTRLNAVALPPAYRDAWFNPNPDGHILATGVDDRGRKQYRYHPQFRSHKDKAKYGACTDFGAALPRLRTRVARDLRQRKATPERAIAAIVRLLDSAHTRIGNEGYARTNKSFGASTLRRRHAKANGEKVFLRYRAKGGQQREIELRDTSLARFVRDMKDLPGQRLFQFIDGDGVARPIGSTEVNDYIREIMGDDFTAKDFRTWGASTIAFEVLAEADGNIGVKTVSEEVAERLGNTPSIARKSYIHPALVGLAKSDQERWRNQLKLPRATRWLSEYERGLIALLKSRKASELAKLALNSR